LTTGTYPSSSKSGEEIRKSADERLMAVGTL